MMRKASIKEASYDQGRGLFLQAHIKALGEEYLDLFHTKTFFEFQQPSSALVSAIQLGIAYSVCLLFAIISQ